MSATAELLEYAAPQEIYYVRPPQAETYGRSLTTMYRLGAFMVGKVAAEAIDSPEADQARVEFYTSVEEGFGTDMKLGGGLEVRDFDARPVIDGRVMAKDLKTPVSDMTHAGLVCAVEKAETEMANHDRRFLPQLTRSKWDHENALIVDKMARGETNYNTRIVISPFPEEAAAESGDAYWRDIGYVPHLKRGFVQVYHMTEDGLIAGSLSFDGSNKERLREVFRRRGIEIPESEVTDNWLQYAVTDTLSKDEAKALGLEIADEAGDPRYKKTTNTVDVTHEYRSIMNTAFNESYVHACESLVQGRQTPEARKLILQYADKAGQFNSRYARALYEMRANEHRFTDDDMVVLHELLVFSTIEMMRAFHLEKTALVGSGSGAYQGRELHMMSLQAMNAESFQNVLSNFGADGARHNRIYSACGLSISLGGEVNEFEGPQSAFGGLSRKELSWHGGIIKKGKCVNCFKETDVGVASWCKKCIKC
jgi:hypothetical protein